MQEPTAAEIALADELVDKLDAATSHNTNSEDGAYKFGRDVGKAYSTLANDSLLSALCSDGVVRRIQERLEGYNHCLEVAKGFSHATQ